MLSGFVYKVPVNRMKAKDPRLPLFLRKGDTEELHQDAQSVFSTVSRGLTARWPPQ